MGTIPTVGLCLLIPSQHKDHSKDTPYNAGLHCRFPEAPGGGCSVHSMAKFPLGVFCRPPLPTQISAPVVGILMSSCWLGLSFPLPILFFFQELQATKSPEWLTASLISPSGTPSSPVRVFLRNQHPEEVLELLLLRALFSCPVIPTRN